MLPCRWPISRVLPRAPPAFGIRQGSFVRDLFFLPCASFRADMSLFQQFLSLSIYLLLALPLHTAAAATNRTIDDTYGDSVTGISPGYSKFWNVGQDCATCAVRPSPNQAFMGTWHDTTTNNPMDYVPHNVTLTFNGTAISVYCIIANLVESDITTFTNISFEMDGAPAGHYVHTPNKGNFEYNVTVYSVAGLSNEQHTLIMTAAQGTSPSLVLFDWAMYTYDDAEASTSSVDASSPQSGTLISPSYTTTTEANLTTIPPDVLTVTLTASSKTPGSLGTGGSSASSTGPLSFPSSSSSTSGVPSATKTGAAVDGQVNIVFGLLLFILSSWVLV